MQTLLLLCRPPCWSKYGATHMTCHGTHDTLCLSCRDVTWCTQQVEFGLYRLSYITIFHAMQVGQWYREWKIGGFIILLQTLAYHPAWLQPRPCQLPTN